MLIRLFVRLSIVLSGALGFLFWSSGPLNAQQPPTTPQQQACTTQGEPVIQPVVNPAIFCSEYLVNDLPHSATATITSIAYAPPCDTMDQPYDWCGKLFFVRPAEGLVQWVGDFDPTTHQYTLHTFAEGLDTPNGLVWHNNSWYVASNQNITQLKDENQDNRADELNILVDSLPHGAGGWTGSIGIGPDDRIYVSQGASCNACQENDPRRAAILSYRLDGSAEQIYASGLRQPFDFAWHPTTGDMWTADNERSHRGETSPLDELNHVPAAGLNFGWPACYESTDGPTTDLLLVTNATLPSSCENTTPPILTFPAHSSPGGMAFYNSSALPELTGDLLIALQGSWDNRMPIGYAVYRVCFDDAGELEICLDDNGNPLADSAGNPTSLERIVPTATAHPHFDDITLSLQELGFYPDHPVGIAISPEGKIAISILEGRIIQLTPRP
ncbi:PQQ-dependent sugar dehydrogenase [Chloroflexota bacterium]